MTALAAEIEERSDPKPAPTGRGMGEATTREQQPSLCKPDMVYILDRAHGLHFFKLAPCQPFAGEILLVR